MSTLEISMDLVGFTFMGFIILAGGRIMWHTVMADLLILLGLFGKDGGIMGY